MKFASVFPSRVGGDGVCCCCLPQPKAIMVGAKTFSHVCKAERQKTNDETTKGRLYMYLFQRNQHLQHQHNCNSQQSQVNHPVSHQRASQPGQLNRTHISHHGFSCLMDIHLCAYFLTNSVYAD